MKKLALSSIFCLILTACGGGGGGGGSNFLPPANPAQTDFEAGIFRDNYDTLYKNLCPSPRPGDDQGSAADENDWLRAWSNDTYLWYDEIIDENPESFTPLNYFDLMQTFELSPTGAPKDKFHFTFDTEAWEQLSQSGVSAGYGIEFHILSSGSNREIYVAYVVAGSPAAVAGIDRGMRLITVDGIAANTTTDIPGLNDGLFPAASGENHSFEFEVLADNSQVNATLTSAQITEDPVPLTQIIDTSAGPVGYMVFNAHQAVAEERLVDEIDAFANAGITELILDLRYNGGGFLDIANQLAFMIAGGGASGMVFDEIQFNDKHPNVDPVTNRTLSPDTFHTTTIGIGDLPSGTPLPTLALSNNRVFVLSGSGTCSASEAIINGLRGIGFEVILVGEPTCGKPYGFYPTDNCGTTYFTIQFRGINAAGFGDYSDGFFPSESPLEPFEVMGCDVNDDLRAALGDQSEDLLGTALGYIEFGDCTAGPVTVANSASKGVGLTDRPQQSDIIDPMRMPGSVRR